MTLDLNSLPFRAREVILILQADNFRLQTVFRLKDEQIRLLNIQRWGPKADKLSEAQIALLTQELVVATPEVEREAPLPEREKALANLPKVKAPRCNHPGQAVLPAHLKRRDEIIPCHPKDCACPTCGLPRPVISYEIREEMGCRPAEFLVRVIKREKRSSHCLEEQGVVVAPVPAQIVPKSKLSDEFIIEVLAAKFQQHTAVFRQCASLLEDHGIELSRRTLNDAIPAAVQWLMPVVRSQATEQVSGNYLQADETTIPCQTPERTGKGHRAYLWQCGRPGGPVVFDFKVGHGRDGPADFLKEFRGKLQCNGYGAYDRLGESITFVACMAYICRGFVGAAKLGLLDPLPVEIVNAIGVFYEIEREARSQNLAAPARMEFQQRKSEPVMGALKTRIVQIRQAVTPACALANACDCALGQWGRMEEDLKDGQFEIDNWCEGAMRAVTRGRKNWLHVGEESAGPKIAAIISIVETCRRLEIKVREYLRDILPKLGDWPINRVAEATSSAWKSAHRC